MYLCARVNGTRPCVGASALSGMTDHSTRIYDTISARSDAAAGRVLLSHEGRTYSD